MEGENINIIDNIIQAISILNKTDEYLDSLADRLSECDKLETDYRHIIELQPVETIDLKKLYMAMQQNLKNRRTIKRDMSLGRELVNNITKLNNKGTRSFLIQGLTNENNKQEKLEYSNRILTMEEESKFIKDEKKRGRPRKEVENAKQ